MDNSVLIIHHFSDSISSDCLKILYNFIHEFPDLMAGHHAAPMAQAVKVENFAGEI